MKKHLLLVLVVFVLSGCATVSQYPVQVPLAVERPNMPGIYHKVEKGQTLWRISKYYNVGIDEIVKINRIPDITQISVGQLLFIPKAEPKTRSVSAVDSDFIWPIRGKVVSFYGSKKDGVLNKGIDICANEGKDVVASRAGKVVFSDSKLKGYGQTIIIDHDDGFSTLYAQNSSSLVKTGEFVKQGQVIAKVGCTGRAKKPCLQFQIRKGDKPQNPFYYLPR